MKKLSLLLLLVLSFACFPRQIIAQENQATSTGLIVNPALFEMVLKPGETITKEIQLTNTTNEPLPISASLERLIPNERELSVKESARFDASLWFKLSETSFIFSPQERRTITVSATAPQDAEPGGHYATIYFEALRPVNLSTRSGSTVVPRVGSIAFVTVPGEIKESFSISRTPDVGRFRNSAPVSASLSVQNTGTIHNFATPRLVIRNWRGKILHTKDFQASIVLPNTERQFALNELPKLGFGLYRYEFSAGYGSGNQRAEGQASAVLVLPYTLLISSLLLGLVLIFIKRTRKRWRHAVRAFKHGNFTDKHQ